MGKRNKALKAAFIQTLPVLFGYLFVGIAFGMLLQERGYSVWWALLMSVFIYAGSMQFVAINFFAGGVGLWEVALMTLVVNFRHAFYGLSFIQKFNRMGKKKPYMIFSLTDETYSLLCGAKVPEGVEEGRLFFYISLLDQIYWIAGSVIGALAGAFLQINTQGIDFAMTALFVVIFVEQWRSYPTHIPALIGGACALLCLFLLGAQDFVMPAMLLIVAVLMALKRGISSKLGSLSGE
ncbi:MAG: AzlC family ABC transporter permease [Christensenellales bacterium]